MTGTDKAKTAAQAGQAVELRQRARDNEVLIPVNQRGDVIGIARDKAGIGLVDEYHRIVGDMLHDAAYLLARQTIARRIVWRGQQQHAGVDAVGVFYHLIDIVGEGVVELMQGVHLEGAVALAGYLVVIPPRILGDENLLIVALHQVIMDGVLQDILATISQEHLLFGHIVNLAELNGDDTLFALIVDTGVEAKRLGIEILYSVDYFLTRIKVKLVSIEKIHVLFHLIYIYLAAKVRIF